MYINLIKEVLAKEEEIVIHYNVKNKTKMFRPSSILISLIGLFYILSGVDIVPEAFVTPKIIGFIDDIIITIVILALLGDEYTKVFGGVKNDSKPVQKVEHSEKSRSTNKDTETSEGFLDTSGTDGDIPADKHNEEHKDGDASDDTDTTDDGSISAAPDVERNFQKAKLTRAREVQKPKYPTGSVQTGTDEGHSSIREQAELDATKVAEQFDYGDEDLEADM